MIRSCSCWTWMLEWYWMVGLFCLAWPKNLVTIANCIALGWLLEVACWMEVSFAWCANTSCTLVRSCAAQPSALLNPTCVQQRAFGAAPLEAGRNVQPSEGWAVHLEASVHTRHFIKISDFWAHDVRCSCGSHTLVIKAWFTIKQGVLKFGEFGIMVGATITWMLHVEGQLQDTSWWVFSFFWHRMCHLYLQQPRVKWDHDPVVLKFSARLAIWFKSHTNHSNFALLALTHRVFLDGAWVLMHTSHEKE